MTEPDLNAVLDAADDDVRDAALADLLLDHGVAGALALNGVDAAAGDLAFDLLLRWLSGLRLSMRADEPDRRVQVAHEAVATFGDEVPSMYRFEALAVLALPAGDPGRDAAAAVAQLRAHLRRSEDDNDGDEVIETIAALLDEGTGNDRIDESLIDEGEAWLAKADEPGRESFRMAAEGYAARRFIDARDAGDEVEMARWGELHDTYVSTDESLSALASRAGQLDMAGRWDEAADVYATIVAATDLSDPSVQQFALRIGELRLNLGQIDAAIPALESVLPSAEDRYLTSVIDEDVQDARERLGSISDALAVCRARADDWAGALSAIDRPRGLRARYQRALRADPAGRELLTIERALDAATRGAVVAGDSDLPVRARLLEQYRKVRPRLDPTALASPQLHEVAAALGPAEAVLVLGLHYAGTLAFLIMPGDSDRPYGQLIRDDFATRQWLELMATDDGDWVAAIGGLEADADMEPGLTAVLEGTDTVLGRWVRQQLDERATTRLTVIPAGMLHLIPWGALPSLRDIDIAMAAGLSEVVHSRSPVGPLPGAALVVSNPTLDLRVSAVASAEVARQLDDAGFGVETLAEGQATEPSVIAGLSGRALLHFAGHGRSEVLRSGLEVHPDVDSGGHTDPFETWVAHVEVWQQPDKGDGEAPRWVERFAYVPGIGQVSERRWTTRDRLDRRLESESGTLLGTYAGDRLLRLSELWSASDVMLADAMGDCRLAVLVACSSGGGFGRSDEAQAGVPTALQLAGVDTVIGTRWEVDEAFAALWTLSFYGAVCAADAEIDVARLVRHTNEEFRTMPLTTARQRILDLAERSRDPFAAMELEAYAHRLTGDRPFELLRHWAAFFMTGRPMFEVEVAT